MHGRPKKHYAKWAADEKHYAKWPAIEKHYAKWAEDEKHYAKWAADEKHYAKCTADQKNTMLNAPLSSKIWVQAVWSKKLAFCMGGLIFF